MTESEKKENGLSGKAGIALQHKGGREKVWRGKHTDTLQPQGGVELQTHQLWEVLNMLGPFVIAKKVLPETGPRSHCEKEVQKRHKK